MCLSACIFCLELWRKWTSLAGTASLSYQVRARSVFMVFIFCCWWGRGCCTVSGVYPPVYYTKVLTRKYELHPDFLVACQSSLLHGAINTNSSDIVLRRVRPSQRLWFRLWWRRDTNFTMSNLCRVNAFFCLFPCFTKTYRIWCK